MQAVSSCILFRFFSRTNENNVETESVRIGDCKVTKTRNECHISKTRNERQVTKTHLINVKPYSPPEGSHKWEDVENNKYEDDIFSFSFFIQPNKVLVNSYIALVH